MVKSTGKWSESKFALVSDSMSVIEFLHLWLTITKSICACVLLLISSYVVFELSLIILYVASLPMCFLYIVFVILSSFDIENCIRSSLFSNIPDV